ncbi:MAG: sigma-70 family RNA polymerase sigma factor [Nannocystaceae bacterium]|nr:sigma-70 family RNA polymerase sigma factor [Nannocystaceae bacterium]
MGCANALIAAFEDADDAELGARLRAAVASARAVWPGVVLGEHAFVHHVGARLEQASVAALDELRTDDLFLACGCVHGDVAALQHFDRFALAPAVAAHVDADMGRDELQQQLRVRLLVRQHDAPARIEQYGGRGSLRAWTRIAVLRAIKDERRARSRRPHALELADGLLDDAAVAADPELEQVRARHGAAFRAAFAAAVAQLDAEARRLLRQHHLHGLTLDTLAAIYGIHRVTAARRLARAREALLEATRVELLRRLQLDASELAHAVAAMMSRLELSVERLLASRDDL